MEDGQEVMIVNGRTNRMRKEQAVPVQVGDVTLNGDLVVPDGATGIVLFAHGSGSSRHSPRNRFVAEALQAAGLATLLIDLLTLEEETIDLRSRALRFDIGLLADRLIRATDWIYRSPQISGLSLGYFGASTGAAAALMAAAENPEVARAVVSRGGRPDLAGEALARVQAPTLLIVGGADYGVIELNQQAAAQLQVENRIEIIRGATHLFEEPGALEQVAKLAAGWFNDHLPGNRPRG
jgi:putative phosphoribosyl transferase